MKTLDLKQNDFGYGFPEKVLLAVLLGDRYNENYKQFDNYMAKCREALKGCDTFCFEGETYPATKQGAKSLANDLYGHEVTKTVNALAVTWDTASVRLFGSAENYLTLMPVCEIEAETYAYPEAKESGYYVGDNVCLTGGSSPYGEKQAESLEISTYFETFNAGSGRVTAGKEITFYIPKGDVTVYKCRTVE